MTRSLLSISTKHHPRVRLLSSLLYVVFLLVAFGLELVPAVVALWTSYGVGLVVVVVDLVLAVRRILHLEGSWVRRLAGHWSDVVFSLLVLLSIPLPALVVFLVGMLQVSRLGKAVVSSRTWLTVMHSMEARPTRYVAFSFLAVILAGALLLMLPSATTDHSGASLVDAVFTSTSATCVTGLIVMNTAPDTVENPRLKTFSRFGQLVILLLIQIGGLGIMTLSASLLIVAGRSLALRSRAALSGLFDESPGKAMEGAMAYILKMTLVAETLGAVILFFRFHAPGMEVGEAIYRAVFHSVSAFCNAGFSLFGDSLTRYAEDPVVNLTIAGLIVAGGLGYTVVALLVSPRWLQRRPRRWARWGLHGQMVVGMTVFLLLFGWLFTFWMEYHHSLAGLSLPGKLLAAFFQSASTRTAGFNTVDLAEMRTATLFLYMLFMFIGASPGGTGGGVKTTTLGILLLAVRSVLYSRPDIEVWGRRIEKDVVFKAISVVAISGMAVSVAFIILLTTESGQSFQAVLFEVISAFGTVGLSLGITPELSSAGKVVLSLLMFLGRLGPLTMALTLKTQQKAVDVRFPPARVAVG